MGVMIGMPCLKLSNNGGSGKHTGCFIKVAGEGLSERKGLDTDIDQSRSHLNHYEGYSSAAELEQYSVNHIKVINEQREKQLSKLKEEYNQKISNAADENEKAHLKKELRSKQADFRKIRNDAIIMVATLIKPPAHWINRFSADDQTKFFEDALAKVKEIVGQNNIKSVAVHYDELGPHMHIFWEPMTDDGRLSAKERVNLAFYNRLNQEMPQHMRDHGWEIDDCHCYDKAEEMKLREELGEKEYNKRRNERKHKNGRDSLAFKIEAEEKKAKAIEETSQMIKNTQATIEKMVMDEQEKCRDNINREYNKVKEQTDAALSSLSELVKTISDIANNPPEIELPKPDGKKPLIGEYYKKDSIEHIIEDKLTVLTTAAARSAEIISNAEQIRQTMRSSEHSSEMNIELNQGVLDRQLRKAAEIKKESDRLQEENYQKSDELWAKKRELNDINDKILSAANKLEQLKEDITDAETHLADPLAVKQQQIEYLAEKNKALTEEKKTTAEENKLLKASLEDVHRKYYRVEECEQLRDFLVNCFGLGWKERSMQITYDPDSDKWNIEDSEHTERARKSYGAVHTFGSDQTNGIDLFKDLINRIIRKVKDEQEKQLTIFQKLKEWSVKQVTKLKKVIDSIASAFGAVEKDRLEAENSSLNDELTLTRKKLSDKEQEISENYVPKWEYENEKAISDHYFKKIKVSRKDVFDNWEIMGLDDAISKAENQRDERKKNHDRCKPSAEHGQCP